MEQPRHIASLLSSLAEFDIEVTVAKGAHRVRVQRGSKATEVLWPQGLTEVFLGFTIDGRAVYSDSAEFYEGESQLEQVEGVARVVRNYLLHEVKVMQSGSLLKRKELHSFRDGQWQSIFLSQSDEA